MRRLLPAVLTVLLVPPFLSALQSPASADPRPPLYETWPTCGTAPDDDGRYCVISVTAGGVPVAPRVGAAEHDEPYIDTIGAGTVRFGVHHFPAGSFTPDGDADPSTTWRWRVNTGDIHPREMFGRARDVDLLVGGSAGTGWTFDLALRPVAIAERFYDPGFVCDPYAACGDDTTTADLEWAGFVTGYVTDLVHDSAYTPEQRQRRTGLVTAYSAQAAAYDYDYETNSVVVRLANPHLRSDGVTPATGSFETFLPYDVLRTDMGVPDPAGLTSGRVQVSRAGSASAPFTLTHEHGGVRIRVTGITFSTPRYTIRPRPSRPGPPRVTRVVRKSSGAVHVGVAAPVADGGSRVTAYVARCRRGAGAWHSATARRSPVVVTAVPSGRAACQARARNRIGLGAWSPARRS